MDYSECKCPVICSLDNQGIRRFYCFFQRAQIDCYFEHNINHRIELIPHKSNSLFVGKIMHPPQLLLVDEPHLVRHHSKVRQASTTTETARTTYSFAHTPWPSTIFPASSTLQITISTEKYRYTLFSASFDGCLGVIIRRNFRRDSASCFSSSILDMNSRTVCTLLSLSLQRAHGILFGSLGVPGVSEPQAMAIIHSITDSIPVDEQCEEVLCTIV
mgnify:CR=1 FL=1